MDTQSATLALDDKPLTLGKTDFRSRLLVGTGKYKDLEETELCLEASGAEIVTVALRRVDFDKPEDKGLMALLESRYTIPPRWRR